MNQDERHPIDDASEPGVCSTLGYLHEQVEQYAEKRDKVIDAETTLQAAEQALLQARLELKWAKRNLTEAIDKSYLVSHACDERIPKAPSIDIPLSPGTMFDAKLDGGSLPSSHARARRARGKSWKSRGSLTCQSRATRGPRVRMTM